MSPFDAAPDRSSSQVEVLLVSGSRLVGQGAFEEAARTFEQALRLDGKCLRAAHGLVWSLYSAWARTSGESRAGYHQRATAALAEAMRRDPDHVGTFALLSLFFLHAGSPGDAARLSQVYLTRHPYDTALTGLIAELNARPREALRLLGVGDPNLSPEPPSPPPTPSPDSGHQNLSFSQEGEDMVLSRIFGEVGRGIYVDVGAHHPLRFSNTHRFYLQGWRGINIEPNPDLLPLFRELRPGDINLACGVSDTPGELTYYMLNEPALNSFDEALARSREGELYRIIGSRPIPVRTLAAILDEHLPPKTPIQFLSVDVEGLDLQVLRSNDWARYRPRCVVAEALQSDVDTVLRSELHHLLTSQGYRFFAKTFNSVFYLEGAFRP